MDWGALARNKWTWVTAGVGGAAGLVVLYLRRRRGGSGGAGGAETVDEPAGYTSGSVGYFPGSASTDFAAQLGQAEQAWQNTFDQFQANVADQLAAIPTEAPTTPTTNPSSPTTYVTVQEGNHVDSILDKIRSYQPNFTLNDLLALNPDIKIANANRYGYISSSNPDIGGSIPVFNVGTSAQVKIPAP